MIPGEIFATIAREKIPSIISFIIPFFFFFKLMENSGPEMKNCLVNICV